MGTIGQKCGMGMYIHFWNKIWTRRYFSRCKVKKRGRFCLKRQIIYKYPKTILNKGTGYLSGYSHSLNPYTGCAFGCSYCYVRQMPVSLFRKEEWGTWVDVKMETANLLYKELLPVLLHLGNSLFSDLHHFLSINSSVYVMGNQISLA